MIGGLSSLSEERTQNLSPRNQKDQQIVKMNLVNIWQPSNYLSQKGIHPNQHPVITITNLVNDQVFSYVKLLTIN